MVFSNSYIFPTDYFGLNLLIFVFLPKLEALDYHI